MLNTSEASQIQALETGQLLQEKADKLPYSIFLLTSDQFIQREVDGRDYDKNKNKEAAKPEDDDDADFDDIDEEEEMGDDDTEVAEDIGESAKTQPKSQGSVTSSFEAMNIGGAITKL